jgi:electron transfer flavoprotein beta subunit
MIVLVKQVPDTSNVGENAMKPDGTVNREALPAIINPEDLYALEQALRVKDEKGGVVTVISMGPPKAEEALKYCLCMGADKAILLSDRKFAASDTLATSYTLKKAIEKIGDFDIIFCGRQAIDGDTAQVGPQVAEKLNINQLTYVFEIKELNKDYVIVKRETSEGFEVAKAPLPILLTITSEANIPRPPSVKRVMAYKNLKGQLSSKEAIEKKDMEIILKKRTLLVNTSAAGITESEIKTLQTL